MSGILYVCLAMAVNDPCVYNEPEHGFGHVSYSHSMSLYDLRDEAVAECEIVHGDEQCEVSCWVSREVSNDDR